MASQSKGPVNHESAHDEGSWAISYGDMITLILCFFVMYFNINPETLKKERSDKITNEVSEKLKGKVLSFSSQESALAGNAKAEAEATQASLPHSFASKTGATVETKANRVYISFPQISFFDSGSVEVTEQGQRALEELATELMPYSAELRIVVKAFTDAKPVRPAQWKLYRDNLELSSLRALAGVRYLTEKGLRARSLRIAGEGEYAAVTRLENQPRSPAAAALPPALSNPLDRKLMVVLEAKAEDQL